MGHKNVITAERLREIVDYDPVTGAFTWRERGHGRRLSGVVGCREPDGYWRTKLEGRKYTLHHLAWLHVHGELPAEELDHRNCDRGDNRLANLRPATRFENKRNRRKSEKTSNPLKGVTYRARNNKFEAGIKHLGKTYYLGSYETAEQANAAYACAAERLFKEFARAA